MRAGAQLNGPGSCADAIATGYSCSQRFCPSCTYDNMCDATCGFCGLVGPSRPPPPPPGGCADFGTSGHACATAMTTVVATDGPGAGYTTYRLSVALPPNAANMYAVFGNDDTDMVMPPAWQAPQVTMRGFKHPHTQWP